MQTLPGGKIEVEVKGILDKLYSYHGISSRNY